MPTTATFETNNMFKLCSECEHLNKNKFRVSCGLQKWEHKIKETFFYDPKNVTTLGTESWKTQNFENGVECPDYKGLTFILTEISATNDPTTEQSISGEALVINYFDYSFVARCDKTKTVLHRNICYSENKKIDHWIRNLEL